MSRCSLILPSCAIGISGRSFLWSWEQSSGNGWRLTLLIGVLPFATDLFFGLLPKSESLLVSLLEGVLWLAIGVIDVCLLSLSYKLLVQSGEDADEEELVPIKPVNDTA